LTRSFGAMPDFTPPPHDEQADVEADDDNVATLPFMAALHTNFPTALTSRRTADHVTMALSDHGFTTTNTLFGASICSDEINFCNSVPKSLYSELGESYGGNKVFNMGGLGGIPFIGKTGLSAGMDHIPDQGNLLLLYASHVGISEQGGEVGKVERCGQHGHVTTACGAAVAAYDLIKKHGTLFHDHVSLSSHDEEEAFIVQELSARLSKINWQDLDVDNPMALVSYQMFDIVRDVLYQELTCLPDSKFHNCQHLALLGGIIINRFDMDDYFQPISFEIKSMNKAANKMRSGLKTVNLLETTFGPKPRLELL
jgi:hypothetical protein